MHFSRELLRLNPLIDGLSDTPTESNLPGDGRRFGVQELGQGVEKQDLTCGYKMGEVG